jgi:hypothetical protein
MKLTITCASWQPCRRNTLVGFASVGISELRLLIRDLAVHEKGSRRWVGLPARPQIKDGQLVRDQDGKLQYIPVLQFVSREVSDAFSSRVVEAVLAYEPHAFESKAEEKIA